MKIYNAVLVLVLVFVAQLAWSPSRASLSDPSAMGMENPAAVNNDFKSAWIDLSGRAATADQSLKNLDLVSILKGVLDNLGSIPEGLGAVGFREELFAELGLESLPWCESPWNNLVSICTNAWKSDHVYGREWRSAGPERQALEICINFTDSRIKISTEDRLNCVLKASELTNSNFSAERAFECQRKSGSDKIMDCLKTNLKIWENLSLLGFFLKREERLGNLIWRESDTQQAIKALKSLADLGLVVSPKMPSSNEIPEFFALIRNGH